MLLPVILKKRRKIMPSFAKILSVLAVSGFGNLTRGGRSSGSNGVPAIRPLLSQSPGRKATQTQAINHLKFGCQRPRVFIPNLVSIAVPDKCNIGRLINFVVIDLTRIFGYLLLNSGINPPDNIFILSSIPLVAIKRH